MSNFIDTLKTKPDREKKQIAFAISFTFVAIIFVFWITAVYPDFRKTQQVQAPSVQDTAPLSSLSETFSAGISSFKNEIWNIKSRLISPPEASVETVPSGESKIPSQPVPAGY